MSLKILPFLFKEELQRIHYREDLIKVYSERLKGNNHD